MHVMDTLDIDALFVGEPVFERRCYMLDVSRDRVPTLETLAWLIGILGRLRFNELQLYIEHTFTYQGHEVVWRDASAYTPQDLAAVKKLASKAGIELVANSNCFGHMERWLAHDDYSDRAECPGGVSDSRSRVVSVPTCLEPTQDNAEFALGLIREMVEAVDSDRVMIGGDEPKELGSGRSAERVAAVGASQVYQQHLLRIIEPLIADGLEVQFWGDQLMKSPDGAAWIPGGASAVVWHYDPPSAEHLGFRAAAEPLIEASKRFWVAAGTSSWNSLIGRNSSATANIADAITVGSEYGARGFMLADWGDNGHLQPLAVSLPSIVRAGVGAWHGVCGNVEVGPIIDSLLGAESGTGQIIDGLGSLADSTGLMVPNGSPIFAALVPLPGVIAGRVDPTGCAAARHALDEARERFPDALGSSGRGRVLAEELNAAVRLAQIGLDRLQGQSIKPARLEQALVAQRSAWLRTSRPGGVADALGRLKPRTAAER
jgi:hexosaminidase